MFVSTFKSTNFLTHLEAGAKAICSDKPTHLWCSKCFIPLHWGMGGRRGGLIAWMPKTDCSCLRFPGRSRNSYIRVYILEWVNWHQLYVCTTNISHFPQKLVQRSKVFPIRESNPIPNFSWKGELSVWGQISDYITMRNKFPAAF